MPFRVFAAGEVLTAANVNDYLAEQAISTFAGTAARASAITAPTEGQFAYLSDSDSLTFYNGSAWVNAGSAIAGTALSSGTATSGQILTANGTGGVSFGNGGLTLINTTSFSGVTSQSISSVFTTTYKNYLITISLVPSATARLMLRVRNGSTDNTTNYDGNAWRPAANSYYSATGYMELTSNTTVSASNRNFCQLTLFNPREATITGGINSWYDAGAAVLSHNGHRVNDTATYDGFTLFASTGNMDSAEVNIYGFNR